MRPASTAIVALFPPALRERITSPLVVGLIVVESVGFAGFTKAAYADTNARACRGDTASMFMSCGADAARVTAAATALGPETTPPCNVRAAAGTVPLTMP